MRSYFMKFSRSGARGSFTVRESRLALGPRVTYVDVRPGALSYRKKNDLQRASDLDQLRESSSEELLNEINACAGRRGSAPPMAVLLALLCVVYAVVVLKIDRSAAQAYIDASSAARELSSAAKKALAASANGKLKKDERRKVQGEYEALEAGARNAEKIAEAKKEELDGIRNRLRSTNRLVLLLGSTGLLGLLLAHKRDQFVRRKPVKYDLDDDAKARFEVLGQGCSRLAEAKRVWRLDTQQAISGPKRIAGAQSFLSRNACRIVKALPPNIKSNIEPWAITCDSTKLFMFPDQMFLVQGGRYCSLPYRNVTLDISSSHFPETGEVPADAVTAGYSVPDARLHKGRNGTRTNAQIPIAVYTQLDLRSSQGLHLRLHISNSSNALAFAAALQSYGSAGRQDRAQSRSKSAFEVLAISSSATQEEIRAAYYRMAQRYHPDKVATLAPEHRELAELRMKEINAAYSELQGWGRTG